MKKYCIKCGAELDEATIFCTECGAKIPIEKKKGNICSSCGAEILNEYQYCIQCGTPKHTPSAQAHPQIPQTYPITKPLLKFNISQIFLLIFTFVAFIMLLIALVMGNWYYTEESEDDYAYWGLSSIWGYNYNPIGDSEFDYDWEEINYKFFNTADPSGRDDAYKDAEGVMGFMGTLIIIGTIFTFLYILTLLLRSFGIFDNIGISQMFNLPLLIGFISIIFIFIGLIYFASSFQGALDNANEARDLPTEGIMSFSWFIALISLILIIISVIWTFITSKKPLLKQFLK